MIVSWSILHLNPSQHSWVSKKPQNSTAQNMEQQRAVWNGRVANRPELWMCEANSGVARWWMRQAIRHDYTSDYVSTQLVPCHSPVAVLPAKHCQHCILFSGWLRCQRLLKTTCGQPRDSRPKAPAPPGGEEPQTFKLGLVSPDSTECDTVGFSSQIGWSWRSRTSRGSKIGTYMHIPPKSSKATPPRQSQCTGCANFYGYRLYQKRLLDIWYLAGLQGENPEIPPQQQGETKKKQAAKSKSKHLLALPGFRNKKPAWQCCSASLRHYIEHQPVQSDFRHSAAPTKKAPFSPPNFEVYVLKLESACSSESKSAWHDSIDVTKRWKLHVHRCCFLSNRKGHPTPVHEVSWHLTASRNNQATKSADMFAWPGKPCSHNLPFAWSSHVPQHIYIYILDFFYPTALC